jgi:hypothetical protein
MFIRQLLGALALRQVRYCLVGGVAVNLHGVPRMTYDVDLVLVPDPENLRTFEEVAQSLGLRCRLPVQLVDFADPLYARAMRLERNLIAVTYTDPTDPLREVDVLVCPPVEPRALVERAQVLDLGQLRVPVASLEDLIALKRGTGRAQDEADIAHLERIAQEADDGQS